MSHDVIDHGNSSKNVKIGIPRVKKSNSEEYRVLYTSTDIVWTYTLALIVLWHHNDISIYYKTKEYSKIKKVIFIIKIIKY